MDIKRSGSQPSGQSLADHFAETVRVTLLFGPSDTGRVGGELVTFEPGSRTA